MPALSDHENITFGGNTFFGKIEKLKVSFHLPKKFRDLNVFSVNQLVNSDR